MAAVISGGGLGLFDARLLEAGGSQVGQGGTTQFVNVATGNLVLQSFDEQLLYRGLAIAQSRTYNSLGNFGATGADGWLTGFERRVDLLSGTFNTAGSVIRRQTGDGAWQDFQYVADNVYVSTDGDGADDTLTFNAGTSTWTWREGSTLREEDYQADGRLKVIREFKSDGVDPTIWTVNYDSGRIASVSNASGDALVFDYDQATGFLASISTLEAGVTRGQVYYTYDAAGRLSKVTQDLKPGGGLADGSYETTYTYVDATSLQIASVSQSDGTRVSYTYDAQGRIATVTRGTGAAAETLTYAYGANSTSITDALNRTWTYAYDAQGRITSLTSPPTSGQSDVTTYQYSGDDLVQTKTVRGSTVLSQIDYQYDARGNQLWQWDLLGNAISRTYDANNQLLTETRYTGVDPDRTGAALPTGGMTTHYVYDNRERLRFVIDATGVVTEFRYGTSQGSIGQVSEQRQFAQTFTGGTFTESALDTWVVGAKAGGSLFVSEYDAWGRLSKTTRYASLSADGNSGVVGNANEITSYTYSAQGLLLQQVREHANAENELTSYAYDGMGRLLVSVKGHIGSFDDAKAFQDTPNAYVDTDTVATTYAYLDSLQQIAVTLDGGATRTEMIWKNAIGGSQKAMAPMDGGWKILPYEGQP